MAASTTTTCSVCVEPFSKARKQVVCAHCNLECCTDCASRYLETSGLTPQCMQCHHLWSHQYIRENFGPSFVKKMADARKRVLFSEQQALFPHTQEYITLTNRNAQLIEDQDALLNLYNKFISYDERLKRSVEMTNERVRLVARINLIENPVRERAGDGADNASSFTNNTAPTKVYLKPCSHGNCKGYVSAEDHTCELCSAEYCSECMEVKEAGVDHRCKPEDVATAKMLRKDTKGCPKCATPIHRISGCPDMFCVQCNTAFNWNTLRINERGNSNPHYYQWLRESGGRGSMGGTPTCGDTPLAYIYRSNNFRALKELDKDNVAAVIFRLHHWTESDNVTKLYKEYRKTRQYQHDFRTITLKSRADYMQNKLTKEKFTQYLLKTNKAMEYNTNIDEIIRTIGLFRQQLIQNVVYSTEFDYESFMTEYRNFVTYINQCISHLEEVYYTRKEKRFINLGI